MYFLIIDQCFPSYLRGLLSLLVHGVSRPPKFYLSPLGQFSPITGESLSFYSMLLQRKVRFEDVELGVCSSPISRVSCGWRSKMAGGTSPASKLFCDKLSVKSIFPGFHGCARRHRLIPSLSHIAGSSIKLPGVRYRLIRRIMWSRAGRVLGR